VIKDVQSMHGTQINDEKLPANTPQVVKVGDVLSFGAEVRRGPEVFPPCKFRIDYEFIPWTLVLHPYTYTLGKEDPVNICLYSRGFQFPESSDIEDEQDHSEEEAQVEDSQEEDMTPVETPPRKQSTSFEAIDLTNDDAEPNEPSNGPQGLSDEEIAADKHAMGQSIAPIVIQGDSDEEDEDDSEEENQQLDYLDSEVDSEDDSDKENNESDNSHDEAADAYGDDWENSEILETESNLDTSQVSEIAPMSARMFHDNKDIPVSSIRTTAGGSTEDSFQGDDHLEKSADTAAWDDDLSEENEDESSEDEDIEDRLPSDTGMRALPPFGQGFPLINTAATPTTGSYGWPTSYPILPPQALSPMRQPSPSDAAMAKSQTINPVQIHHLPGNQFSNYMANTLGEKSGKKDFFEAREINRARVNDEGSRNTGYNFTGEGIARPKFNQLGHPYNPRQSAPGPMQNTGHQQVQYLQRQQLQRQQLLAQQMSRENTFAQPRNFQQQMAFTQQVMQQRMAQAQAQAQHAQNTQKRMAEQNTSKLSGPSASMPIPSTFASQMFATPAKQPSVEPEVQSPALSLRAPSPELDMTSAAKFNESKAAIAAMQPGRSAVRINDIVEPLATEPDAKSLKRKADDISDVLEEEVRVWASKDSSVSAAEVVISSDVEAPTENTSQQQVSGSVQALPSASVDPSPVEPAHKKIKRFAEVVGLTALGGLAGGVALFSALVATAPNFP
jgi:hypothetical protein